MKPTVIPAVLGWSNPDTGPADLRAYATDQGPSPRWAKPHARVIEDALIEAGCTEGDRLAIVIIGDRFTDVDVDAIRAALSEPTKPEATRPRCCDHHHYTCAASFDDDPPTPCCDNCPAAVSPEPPTNQEQP